MQLRESADLQRDRLRDSFIPVPVATPEKTLEISTLSILSVFRFHPQQDYLFKASMDNEHGWSYPKFVRWVGGFSGALEDASDSIISLHDRDVREHPSGCGD